MITAGQIYDFLNQVAPFDTQLEFDNSGLLVGDRSREITRAIFCLDVTEKAIAEAEEFGAELIISHHPVIFDPLVFVPTKSIVAKAIRKRLTVICAHTNWDAADGGVSEVLATLLGLTNVRRLADEGEEAMLFVGELPVAMTARDFAELASEALDTVVSVSLPDKELHTVAVCGGAGGSFWTSLIGKDVDALLTGEVKHHDFLDAKLEDISLLAAGHYETETISMPVLMNLVKQEFSTLECKYIEETPVEYIG